MLPPSVIGRNVFDTTSTCSDERGLLNLTHETANKRGADHPFFTQGKNRPEVIAHRGGNGQWPGETMFAYKKAMEIGVDVLEMDVYLTKKTNNHHLVLMHDNDIRKTTSYEGTAFQVHNFTLEELKELNAAHKWSPGGSNSHPYRNDPNKDLKVTSLEEVFGEFPGVRMNIEMKWAGPEHSPAAKLSEMICRKNMRDKVLVASLSDEYMHEFRSLCPEVATSASKWELLKFEGSSLIGGSARPDADAIQVIDRLWPVWVVTDKLVDRSHCSDLKPESAAHCRKLPVHAWTVNDLEAMRRMIDLKVDGIITDYPGSLLALLDRLKIA
jgi:glycerophosphoryl diester phosphodiesterase